MIFVLIFGPLIFTSLVTMLMGNFFELAGVGRQKAMIPIQNVFLWFKITQRSPVWGVLFFVPYINIILIIWLVTEFLKCFGKYDLLSQVLGIFFGYIYLPVLNFVNPGAYTGKGRNYPFRRARMGRCSFIRSSGSHYYTYLHF